jgi:iron(III) transport system substrate-binding protein
MPIVRPLTEAIEEMTMTLTMLRNLLLSGSVAGALFAPAAALADGEVNLYTTREPGLIQPLIDVFSAETGITVNTVFVKDGLAERVVAEGANSPADMLMTVDIGVLVDLVNQGVTQPVESGALEAAVPENLRDPDGHWFALSKRARVLYADKDLDLSSFTYEGLADPKWKGKFCIRAGQHPYNNAFFAAYLARNGAEKTEAFLKAIKANTARKPGGGDRDVARDILSGQCDIAIINTYYIGLMSKATNEQKGWYEAIKPLKTTFTGGGTHVNVSAAAIAKNAPNKDSAVKLIEYMLGEKAQTLYADGNFEYPVNADVKEAAAVKLLGALTPDTTPLGDVAKNRKAASELVDKVGFDN